jgi:hypothetical protein
MERNDSTFKIFLPNWLLARQKRASGHAMLEGVGDQLV